MTKPLKEQEQIPIILEFFELPKAINIAPIKNGISNHNYFVSTSAGEFVIRFLISKKSKFIKNDIYIQNCLKKTGVGSPTYIKNKQDEFVFFDGKNQAVIYKKIDGATPFHTNEKLSYDFGKTLALFHSSVKDLPEVNKLGLLNSEKSGVDMPLFNNGVPKGIIHGDFHPGNALVSLNDNDKIIAMLDFEDASENYLIIDLGLTLMTNCSYDGKTIDRDLIKALLDGYNSIRQLSNDEKQGLNGAVIYAANTWIKWFEENGYEKYTERHKSKLESFKYYFINNNP